MEYSLPSKLQEKIQHVRAYRGPADQWSTADQRTGGPVKITKNKVGYHDAGLIDIGGFLNNFATGNYGKQFNF